MSTTADQLIEPAWMIWFDDSSIGPSIFTGCGSEKAARQQFDLDGQNWACHLFKKVASHE